MWVLCGRSRRRQEPGGIRGEKSLGPHRVRKTAAGPGVAGVGWGGGGCAVRAVEEGRRWVKSRQVMKVKKEPCE